MTINDHLEPLNITAVEITGSKEESYVVAVADKFNSSSVVKFYRVINSRPGSLFIAIRKAITHEMSYPN